MLCHPRLHSQHWWGGKRHSFPGNSVHQPNTTAFCYYSVLGNLSGQRETESASLPREVIWDNITSYIPKAWCSHNMLGKSLGRGLGKHEDNFSNFLIPFYSLGWLLPPSASLMLTARGSYTPKGRRSVLLRWEVKYGSPQIKQHEDLKSFWIKER